MSNIVERLRSPANVFYEYAADNGAFLREAADEITRLRDELAAVKEERDRMKEAIKLISGQPLSSELDAEAQDNADYKGAYDSCIKAARAALEGVTEPAKGDSNA